MPHACSAEHPGCLVLSGMQSGYQIGSWKREHILAADCRNCSPCLHRGVKFQKIMQSETHVHGVVAQEHSFEGL